jgi:signal transduction histidine kinase
VFTGIRLRRELFDWAAPVAVVIFGIVNIALHAHRKAYPGSPVMHVTFLVLGALVLGLRRRAPAVLPLLAIAIASAWAASYPHNDQGPFEGFLILVGAAYCVGSGNRGHALRRASTALGGFVVAVLILSEFVGGGLGDVAPVVVWVAAAWGIGVVLNRRTQQTAQARADAAAVAEQHAERMAAAVEDERSRIARELHDVVAHALSVIVVQSAAERRAVSNGRVDPVAVESVLDSVERLGREALVDLRRLLGLLRATGESAALAPQPSLDDLDTLLGQVRETGVDVRLSTEGEPGEVPAGVGLTAYRIVQEALTNVVKHAHASTADVVIRYRPHAVEIEVRDDGGPKALPAAALPSGGHGLVGIHERATVFGGSVTVGPVEPHGWQVHAVLPTNSSAVAVA